MSRVLHQVLEPAAYVNLPRLIKRPVAAAERDQRAPPGFSGGEALVMYQLARLHLDMEAHLLIHIAFHVAALKQRAQPPPQPLADHVASSTCSTAEVNTRQFFFSAANTFLPLAVRR